uniref:Uncharacterized protein n=1 Tax=Ixodes ricinus TaxID=34613 RepID=A0A6B0V086_IXORI
MSFLLPSMLRHLSHLVCARAAKTLWKACSACWRPNVRKTHTLLFSVCPQLQVLCGLFVCTGNAPDRVLRQSCRFTVFSLVLQPKSPLPAVDPEEGSAKEGVDDAPREEGSPVNPRLLSVVLTVLGFITAVTAVVHLVTQQGFEDADPRLLAQEHLIEVTADFVHVSRESEIETCVVVGRG